MYDVKKERKEEEERRNTIVDFRYQVLQGVPRCLFVFIDVSVQEVLGNLVVGILFKKKINKK